MCVQRRCLVRSCSGGKAGGGWGLTWSECKIVTAEVHHAHEPPSDLQLPVVHPLVLRDPHVHHLCISVLRQGNHLGNDVEPSKIRWIISTREHNKRWINFLSQTYCHAIVLIPSEGVQRRWLLLLLRNTLLLRLWDERYARLSPLRVPLQVLSPGCIVRVRSSLTMLFTTFSHASTKRCTFGDHSSMGDQEPRHCITLRPTEHDVAKQPQ
jgi:hypothetical protein